MGFVAVTLTGLALGATLHMPILAMIVLLIGVAYVIFKLFFDRHILRLVRDWNYKAQGQSRWWYVRETGAVEEGIAPRGPRRDGPYRTRDEALRAPEIAKQRATAWNNEND